MKKRLTNLIISFLIFLASSNTCFATNYYITPTGAGLKNGSSWANAFDWTGFDTSAAASVSNDHYWLLGGTYTVPAGGTVATSRDGLISGSIWVIGVKSTTTAEPPTVADWAYGDDRPYIDLTTNTEYMQLDNYWNIYNLRMIGDGAFVLRVDYYSSIYNVKVISSGGVGTDAIYMYGLGFISNSEVSNPDGTALFMGQEIFATGVYAHDSATGFEHLTSDNYIINSVAETCVTGIDINTANEAYVANSVIYNNITGIKATTQTTGSSRFFNNIIVNNTTGASWDDDADSNYWDFNIWDNTTDGANITTGSNSITGDPGFTDPDATPPDFTVGEGSNALDAGLPFSIGLTGDLKWNVGISQDDATVGGGGTTSYGFSN